MSVSLGSPPKASSISVSKSMKSNKSKNTKPEVMLRKKLWSSGVKGYRLNWENAPGRPDICFPGKKIAIFVNGCFWHRCQKCNLPLPKTNTEFWKNKFIRNVERDKLKIQRLKNDGWKVLVVWECDIKNNLDQVVDNIKSILY
ncbi:MAG TPA: very short patch repair endonuclease [Bacteroidetes bacterium]|nr:very short patch repair endonuclease [Bacteroidota bacterium]